MLPEERLFQRVIRKLPAEDLSKTNIEIFWLKKSSLVMILWRNYEIKGRVNKSKRWGKDRKGK